MKRSVHTQSEFAMMMTIFRLLKGVNISPLYMAVPVVLSVAAAVFEGVSMGLLMPLLSGFLQKDFSFIKETPYLSDAIAYLPPEILSSDRYLFIALLGFLIVAVVLKNVLKYGSIVGMSYIANRARHHLRKEVFGRYLSFGKLFFDRANVGHHATLLTEFIDIALKPIIAVPKYMNAFFSLIAYLVVMLFISWQLTLFALPLFALLHFIVRKMIVKIRALSRDIADRGKALGKQSVNILSTIPLVKAYGTESQERKNFARISDEKARFNFHTHALQELILPMQETITLLLAVLMFILMAYLMVEKESVEATSLIVYFYLVLNASSRFGTLMGFRGTLALSSGPLDEVMEVFDEEGKYFVRGGDDEFTGLKKSLELKNLSFSYSQERGILKDVSLEVEKGTMVALVGPTGSGKTTIVSLLMRYYDCPEDSIFIDSKDIRSFQLDGLLKKIALVSQETLLLHDSLRNNITYGLDGVSDKEIQEVLKRARLTNFIKQLPEGLETLIGDRGVKLSGGEKQRVSIARALLKDAEILILDEATSSLDSQTEKLIQEAVDEAVQGRTSIVIAHRLSTIKNADKIVVLEEGKKVEEGTLDDLIEKEGVFFRLWEEQKF